MGRLDGKIAVVTGAAMGNGLGITRVFCREGASVAMLDVQEKVFESARGLEGEGRSVLPLRVDIRDFAAVKEAVEAVAKEFERIDILVNNAGVARLVPFLEMSDEVRDLHFDVNIKGTWNCTKAVLPKMIERSYGKIVNLSSVTGPLVADTGETAYAVTKAGIWGFTKALAMEVVAHKINVNMICPGMVDTPMVRSAAAEVMPDDPQVVVDMIASGIPMKRLANPEEIGELAAFLASDAAGYITGQSFIIDGGSTLPESPLAVSG